MTDVTGFGLLGHLTEMAEGSGKRSSDMKQIPLITADLTFYIEQKVFPAAPTATGTTTEIRLAPLPIIKKQF